jgi:hypothetical protein
MPIELYGLYDEVSALNGPGVLAIIGCEANSVSKAAEEEPFFVVCLRRLRMKNRIAAAINTTIPPTTPPTMGPTEDDDLDGVGETDIDEGVVGLVTEGIV